MRPKQPYTLKEATKKLEHYCAYQERCHSEVLAKLKEMRMIPEAIDLIMAHLIQDNYLNEERFAKRFVSGKFTIKKWGRKRIVSELKKHGISRYNIHIGLQEIDEDAYLETLDRLLEKRLAQLTGEDLQKKKKKLVDYLLYRGWESELVYQKVYTILNKAKT